MWAIKEHRGIKKACEKAPAAVVKKYELWKDLVFRHGPEKLKEFPGFHDEKLQGRRGTTLLTIEFAIQSHLRGRAPNRHDIRFGNHPAPILGTSMAKRSARDFVVPKAHARLTTGEVIRMLRELKGWTQQELAKRSGINATNISMLENERVDIGKKRASSSPRRSRFIRPSSCSPNMKQTRSVAPRECPAAGTANHQ